MDTKPSLRPESAPFERIEFIERFANRREGADSVNRILDEPTILKLATPLAGRRVLDIGCGLGHLASSVASLGAEEVWAIDTSSRMIEEARSRFSNPRISYKVAAIEELMLTEAFDTVVSSMVIHFVPDLRDFLKAVCRVLRSDGVFVFSQRHPIRTCNPSCYASPADPSWQVARYFDEGPRDYTWLNAAVTLHHRTLTTIMDGLSKAGFVVDALVEPVPAQAALKGSAIMREAQATPMILTFKAVKRIRSLAVT